jgi:hypothetical protein
MGGTPTSPLTVGMSTGGIDRASSVHQLGRLGPARGADYAPSPPEGLVMSYLTVTQAFEAECQWEPRLNAATSGMVVNEGIVILTGRVATFAETYAAAHRRLGSRGPRGGQRARGRPVCCGPAER